MTASTHITAVSWMTCLSVRPVRERAGAIIIHYFLPLRRRGEGYRGAPPQTPRLRLSFFTTDWHAAERELPRIQRGNLPWHEPRLQLLKLLSMRPVIVRYLVVPQPFRSAVPRHDVAPWLVTSYP